MFTPQCTYGNSVKDMTGKIWLDIMERYDWISWKDVTEAWWASTFCWCASNFSEILSFLAGTIPDSIFLLFTGFQAMLIFGLHKIVGLTLSPSRSSKTFTLALVLAYCSSTFSFCSLNSVVCFSSRNRTSANRSEVWSFSLNALSFLDDLELDDDTFECLLDLSDDTIPDALDPFDFDFK